MTQRLDSSSRSSLDVVRELFNALGGEGIACNAKLVSPLEALPLLRKAVGDLEEALSAERAVYDASPSGQAKIREATEMRARPGMPYELRAGHSLSIEFEAEEGDEVYWSVKSPVAVAAYIIDSENQARFDRDEEIEWDAGHGRLTEHDGNHRIPEDGTWHLLIINESHKSTPIVFELDVELLDGLPRRSAGRTVEAERRPGDTPRRPVLAGAHCK